MSINSKYWNEEVRAAIKAQREFGRRGPHWDNAAVGQVVLHEDLAEGLDYGLYQEQTDRLLAHARQDAAHALCNTKSLLDYQRGTRWKLRFIFLLQLVIIYLLLK